jgi:GNAT superfamily N-acetyltransferase
MRVTGKRVVVRPPKRTEDGFVDALLDEFGCEAGVMVIERRADREAIGVVAHRVDEPKKGWLTFGLVAMRDGLRGFGYGSEAVRLLEERSGARQFRAEVAKSIGLAFYFWLRQGYRPAGPDEAFWPVEEDNDIIHLIRIPEEKAK